MKDNLIDELIDLTKPFVGRSDLIQGPGGNTSVKDGNGLMTIKASGYRFEEISKEQGYSIVKNSRIRDYFFNLVIQDKIKEEAVSTTLIQDCILLRENNIKYPKPSMETGFHAVLDKYVVHTHSVWTNLVNCNLSSHKLLPVLKQKLNTPISYIPFVSPGLGLSYLITQEIKHAHKNNLPVPGIFFLENHGIIAHGNSPKEVTQELENLDRELCSLFGLNHKEYPSTALALKNNIFYPTSDDVSKLLKEYNADVVFFDQVLFPDQTVFFKNNISFGRENKNKINISQDYVISYACNEREACSIHETMTAFLFIYDAIQKAGHTPRLVEGSEIDYINNMEMEKYRKSLMQ